MLFVQKKYILVFALVFASSVFLPFMLFSEGDTEKSKKTIAQQEKDTIRYGLDTEVIALLERVKTEKNSLYSDDFFELYNATKSPALHDALVGYFTQIEDKRLADDAIAALENQAEERAAAMNLWFAYVRAVKLEKAAPALRAILETEDSAYFDGALAALGGVGGSEDAVFLADFLDKEGLTLGRRQTLMKTLGELKAEATAEKLAKIVEDSSENAFVRMYAAEALGQMENADYIPLLSGLLTDGDANLRAGIVRALSYHPKNKAAQEAVMQAIRSEHVKVRLEAIAAAKKMDFKDAIPFLLFRAEHDAELPVKYASYDAIASLDSSEGNAFLISVVVEPKNNDTMRERAASALIEYGKAGMDEVIALARESLADDKKKNLRYALGKAFAKHKNARFGAICREYLASKDTATCGTGLDIFATGRYGEAVADVKAIAGDSKAGSNQRKAQRLLDE